MLKKSWRTTIVLVIAGGYAAEAESRFIIWVTAIYLLAILFGLFDSKRLRRLQRPPTFSMAKLSDIADSLDVGVWEWNPVDNALVWDEAMYRLYGHEPGAWPMTFEKWEHMVHPDDRAGLLHEYRSAIHEQRMYSHRFRIVLPTGRVRYIEARSKTGFGGSGKGQRVVGMSWDATSQALAEQELEIQKNLNEKILDNIPISVFIKDIKENFKIVLWNKASEDLFEYDKASVIGRSAHQVWPKEHADLYLADDLKVTTSGQLLDIPEEPVLTAGRGTISLHTKKIQLKMKEDSDPRYLLCITEDITERKRNLEEQKANEYSIRVLSERLALAVLGAGFGVWEFDLQSNRLIWDEQMYRIYGYTPATFDGSIEVWRACVHPEDIEFVDQRFSDLMNGIAIDVFVFRSIRAHDRQLRYVEANGYRQLDSEGNPRLLVGMNRDITERKMIEISLAKSEQTFRTIFESAPLGIAVISSQTGYFNEINSHFAGIAGRSIQELKSLTWMSLTHPDDIEADLNFMAQLNAGTISSFKMTKRYLKPDGTIIWIAMAVAALHRDFPSPAQHLCMIEDISDRIRTEAELKKAKELAEEATQVKSTFLANMSHEIRTPLAVIRGFAELLLNSKANDELSEAWISTIVRSSQQLELLLGDILDLSKVESGKLLIEYATVSLADFMDDIRSVLEIFALDKGIQLGFKVRNEVPAEIHTDPNRLKQILTNIVNNAIKFTEHGHVEVTIHFQPGDEERKKSQLVFEIEDTGIGIRPDQREKIFSTFTQADNSITRRFGGTGLGLALARDLAHLLGGDVVLGASEVNQGTTFIASIDPGFVEGSKMISHLNRMEIPRPSLPPDLAEGHELAEFHILVAEDAPDLRALFKMVLENHGASVDTAANGLESIEMASHNSYDLILMDIQMPVLGGYEATRHLRENACKVPIIALTAHAMKGERERCLEAGFSDHLSKPIDFKKLLLLIDAYGCHAQPGTAFPVRSRGPMSGFKASDGWTSAPSLS